MKKLFISIPMEGKTTEEIKKERDIAVDLATEKLGEEVEVLDTVFDDFGPDAKPLEFLARALTYLVKADIAFFGKGWEKRRGCKIEHTCAVEYGIPVLHAE